MRPGMKTRSTIPAVAVMLLLACLNAVGCRLLADLSDWEIGAFSQSTTPTSRLTDTIAEAIDVDGWTANPNWSPITEENSPLRAMRFDPSGPRWQFRPMMSREKLLTSAQADQRGESNADIMARRASMGLGRSGTFQVEDIVAAFDPRLRSTTEGNMTISDAPSRSPSRVGPTSAVRETAVKHLAAVAERDNLSGWNAAILLAQRDPHAAQPYVTVLARLVADPPRIEIKHDSNTHKDTENDAEKPQLLKKESRLVSVNMRAAAAEAWCLVLATAETDAETAMNLPGQVLEDMHRGVDSRQLVTVDIPLVAEAELMRGLGRRMAPARIRRLENYLVRPLYRNSEKSSMQWRQDSMRRAAIDACILHAMHLRDVALPTEKTLQTSEIVNLRDAAVWPQILWDCESDPESQVRSGYGLLLSVARDPRAFDVLTAQVADTHQNVQRRALRNLGLLRSDKARDQLREYMQRKSLLRKIALQGLAAYGAEELIEYLSDEDAGVRQELARQLTQFQSRRSAFALVTLLSDRVPSVQQAVLDGLEGWPDDLLLPLLLHGAVDGGYRTRDISLSMLRARTGNVSAPFRADDAVQTRRNQATTMAQRWRIGFPLLKDSQAIAALGDGRPDLERVAEIESRLQRAVGEGSGSTTTAGGFETEWFHRLKSEDLPAVEQALMRSSPTGRNFLFRDVLPRLDPEYEALALLEESNLSHRRQGAAQLRGIGRRRSLRDPVLGRLSAVLIREEDVLVWRDIIVGIEQDGTEPAAKIVQLAVNHRWPDVRLVGCQYVERHGRPDYGIWMQRLFQDPNPAVQLAAIKAAGRCGNQRVLDDALEKDGHLKLIGLRRLLTVFSGEKHLAVVASMSRLLDQTALDELNRLSHSGDWRTRIAAIEVIAETGQTRFLNRLIDIVWLGEESRPEVQRAALKAIEKMIPSDEHPTNLQTAQNAQQRAAVWHTWWQKRSGGDRRSRGPAITPTPLEPIPSATSHTTQLIRPPLATGTRP